jgi:hypothetical protein
LSGPFGDLQPGCFVSLEAGFAANIVDRRSDALLDRELELVLLFLQCALPSKHLSLSLLGFSQFDVVGRKGGTRFLGFLRLRPQFGRGGLACLLGLSSCYSTPLGLQPCVELLPGGGELFLFFAQGFGFLGNFGILTGELFLKPFAVFLDERRRAAEMRAALLAA